MAMSNAGNDRNDTHSFQQQEKTDQFAQMHSLQMWKCVIDSKQTKIKLKSNLHIVGSAAGVGQTNEIILMNGILTLNHQMSSMSSSHASFNSRKSVIFRLKT